MPGSWSGGARRVLLWSSACLAVLAWSPTVAGSAGGRCAGGGAEALRCLVNGERRDRGLPELRPSSLLTRAARAHAKDMAARDFFSHLAPEGGAADERARRVGFLRGAHEWGIGEAIGYVTRGRRHSERLMAAFMASPEHRGLLMDPDFDLIGIGIASGWPVAGKSGRGLTAVVDLGRARRTR